MSNDKSCRQTDVTTNVYNNTRNLCKIPPFSRCIKMTIDCETYLNVA